MTHLLRRAWACPLWVHVVAYAVLLVALLPVVRPWDATFTPDEGSYGLQARMLRAGQWEFDWPAARLDPDGDWFPVANVLEGDDGHYVYAQHPLYALALTGATEVAGEEAGLRLVPMLGALGAAVAAWLLAGELDPRARRPAFWIAGMSPLLVNATVPWAHTLSAATAGFAALAAVRLVRGGRAGPALPALIALATFSALGVLLRAEGLLLALALGLALVGIGVARRRVAVVSGGVTAVAAAGIAALAERAWVDRIVGQAPGVIRPRDSAAEDAGGVLGYVEGRFEGAWHSLLAGAYDAVDVAVLGVPIVGLAVFAGLKARRRDPGWEREVVAAGALVVVLYVVRFAWTQRQPVTGLVAAWPLAVVALVPLAWRTAPITSRLLALTASLFAAAILATQYEIGGGLEWGGRFFSPAIPILAALAAAGVLALTDGASSDWRPRLNRVLGWMLVVPVALGTVSLGVWRGDNAELVDEVEPFAAGVVVTHEQVLPRTAWRTQPDATWLLVPIDELEGAIETLRRRETSELTVVIPWFLTDEAAAIYPGARDETGPAVAAFGWRTLVLRP